MANNIKNSITVSGSEKLLVRYDNIETLIKEALEGGDNDEEAAIIFGIYQRSLDDIPDLSDLIGSNKVCLYDDMDSSFESGDDERKIHLMSAWAPLNPIALDLFRKIHRENDMLTISNEWIDEDDPIQRGEYTIRHKPDENKLVITESFIDLNELSTILDEEIDSYEFDYDNDDTCEIVNGELLISEDRLMAILEDTTINEEAELNCPSVDS